MKILLVYPAKVDENGNVIKYKKAFLPPLSLAILSTLTPPEHSVKVVNDIAEEIDFTVDYDLVGITAMTSQITRAYQVADQFRQKGIKVVIGGVHATFRPQEALEHADAVVIGEAENIWPQLLDDFKHGTSREFYQESSLPDLAPLVIPKWDSFNMKIYPRRIGKKLPTMPIFTTRGCAYNCKFCSVTKFFGRSYRVKPVDNVLSEIASTAARNYFFVDDNIVGDIEYARELFRALSRLKPLPIWMSQISTTVMKHPELIDAASQAGCGCLFIGLESITTDNLVYVKKRFNNVESYEEMFTRLTKAGIASFASIIVGLDYDTSESICETLDFLIRNKVTMASFFILTPMPGTDLFDEMKSEGRILHDQWHLYDLNHVVFQPAKMSTKELTSSYWNAFQGFFSLKNILRRDIQSLALLANSSNRSPSRILDLLFFQLFYRRTVNSYEHPFSGGIMRVNGRG